MTKFANPFAPKLAGTNAKSDEIKSWVRELKGLSEDTPITVAEIACRDNGCPDIETVIGVLESGKPTITLRVHSAMVELTKAEIAQLVDNS